MVQLLAMRKVPPGPLRRRLRHWFGGSTVFALEIGVKVRGARALFVFVLVFPRQRSRRVQGELEVGCL